MYNNDGPLAFDAVINDSDFNNSVNRMEGKIKGMTSTFEQETGQWDGIIKSFAIGMASAFTIDKALEFRKQLISVRGEFQKYEAVLANSLGSQEDAAESMEMLTNVASKTPFQLDSLTDAYVKLVNQGFKPSEKEIIKLGDLSASTGKQFGQLAEAVLDAQTGEFERLKEFGIKAKVSGDQVQLSFKGVQTTVDNTSESIKNYILSLGDMQGVKGSMEAISKTLVGQVSNLEDAITQMFNQIGQDSEGFLSDSISATKYLVDNYAEIAKWLGVLITAYGSYKAAVIATVVVERVRTKVMLESALAGKTLTTWEALHSMTLKKVQAAQALLNKTMMANPYAIAAVAIGALISYMVLFKRKTDEISEAQKKFKEESSESLSEVTALFEQLKKTNAGTIERKNIIDQLNSKYGEFIGNMKLEKATLNEIEIAEKAVSNAILERLSISGKTADLTDLTKKRLDTLRAIQSKVSKEEFAEINDYIKNGVQAKLVMNKVTGMLEPQMEFKSWGKEIDGLVSQIGVLKTQEDEVTKKWNELIANIKTGASSIKVDTPSKPGGDNNKLKELKTDYSELADEIERLEADAERKGERMSELFIDKLSSDAEAEYNRWEKHKNLIATVITETKTLNQKLFDINQEYSEKEAALRESSNGIDLDDRLSILKEEKQKAIDIALDEAAKRTEIYKEITKTVISEGETELKSRLANIRIMLQSDKLSAGMRLELMKLLADTEQKLNQDTTDKKKKSIEELAQSYNDIANSLTNVADSVSLIDENMGKIIGQAGQFAGQLGSSIKQLTEATSTEGKVAGFSGIVNTLFQVADLLDKQFGEQKRIADLEKERANYNKSLEITLEEINYQLERQLELLDSMPNEIKLLKSIDEYVKSIKRANAELSKMQFDFAAAPKGVDATITIDSIKYITKEKDAYLALSKALKDGLISQEDYDIAISYLEAIKTGTRELEQLKKEYEEYITGTSVQTLVDEIAQMFQQGKVSAADFANNFKQLMTNAMLQSLKMKMLEPALTAWFNDFSGYLQSNGGLSQYEITALAEQYEAIFGTASAAWEEMMKIIGGFGTNATGPDTQLTGAIKGVTEETASIIAGQMNAIRINQAEMLDINRDSLMYLSNIDRHTNELHHMRRTLDRMAGDVSKNSNSQNNSML